MGDGRGAMKRRWPEPVSLQVSSDRRKRQAESSMWKTADSMSTAQGKKKKIPFFQPCILCFRCENAVINLELSACLKIVLHLLLLFPLVTKAIVYFSRWKRSCEKLFTWCRREHREAGPREYVNEWGWGWLAPSLTQDLSCPWNLWELPPSAC